MELPDLIYVLIGVVLVVIAWVLVVMNRRRNHALRDRFAEESERLLYPSDRPDHRR